MRFEQVALVFRKEGRELLRDRRTLFVNVVLPVLLYPVLALFAIQVVQLTQPTADDAPRLATIDLPDALRQALPRVADDEAAEPGQAVRLLSAGGELRQLVADLDPSQPPTATQRREILQALRANDLVGLLWHRPLPQGALQPGDRVILLLDDAHRQQRQVGAAVEEAVDRQRQRHLAARLDAAGLDADFIRPVQHARWELAPPAEAARSQWAGIIPMLLVFMALSGAFYPALDLIAGERERGTLESLLSWPGGRVEIFTGKLLVVIVAALVSVVLNLTSLGVTAGLVNQQVAGAGGGPAFDLSFGIGILLLCLLALLPLVIMLAAVALGLAGLAASYKEAQNYLSPLLIAVMVPAMLALAPNAQPSLVLDLVPVVGPILALKASLQAASVPWLHLGVATAASTGLAAVVVTWAVRLLEREQFLYPGLVRAGWGRFRRWGSGPAVPGGVEVLAVYAVATGAFLSSGALVQDLPPVARVVVPLVLCIAGPAVLHAWLGAYSWRRIFAWCRPAWSVWLATILLIPLGVGLSVAIGQLQDLLLGSAPELPVGIEVIEAILDAGGLPLALACLALTPAVCEELLCRGTLLSGLRRSLGPIGGVVLAAFCFAVLHGHPWRLLPQLALGIVLGVLVLRSGSLWPAILLHFGHNAVVVALEPRFELVDADALEDWLTAAGQGLWWLVLAGAVVGNAVLLRWWPLGRRNVGAD